MKGLLMTVTILCITLGSLHTQHMVPHYDSSKNGFAKLTGDHVHKPATGYSNTPPDKAHLEEPAGVLNQAGNIILPALKMFQKLPANSDISYPLLKNKAQNIFINLFNSSSRSRSQKSIMVTL